MPEITEDEAVEMTKGVRVTSHRVRPDGLNIWTVDYRPVLDLTIDVEADNESEARAAAANALVGMERSE